jgi:hypothetical protein
MLILVGEEPFLIMRRRYVKVGFEQGFKCLNLSYLFEFLERDASVYGVRVEQHSEVNVEIRKLLRP